MSISTFFRIFTFTFLTLCVYIPSYSQVQQRASVVSAGGGASSSGDFRNFGVIGEAIVSPQIGNGNFSGQVGYIYMTLENEPYYIGRNDSLILVDMYNSMGGQNWTISWDLSSPVVDWAGVEIAYGSVFSVNLNDNNLTGTMPTSVSGFSRINKPNFEINIGANRLDFESAEDFVNLISLFTYSPQAKIYSTIDTTILQGQSITFTSETPGNFNTYQWFKDNAILIGETNPTLEIINAIPDDAGMYYCVVRNTQATQLVLERHTIDLNVEGFVNSTDSLALVRIFEENGGINWIMPWNLNNPVATWEGVTLRGDKLRELDLSRRNLVGVLPEVFNADLFSELRYLSFFDNRLEGQIPTTIGELLTLTYLDLDKNQFSGSVPASFGGLVNLQALWLSRNNLDTLPEEIGNLSSLQSLYLNDNNFTSLPSTIGNLSELLVLNVSDNELSIFPNSITNLRRLRELYANRNFIATLPPAMNNLIDLIILEMNSNKLSSLPTELLQLINLTVLGVAENSLEFDDLLPYANRSFQTFHYSQQAPIDEEQDILVAINESVSFGINTEGNGNRYQWFKDGQAISTLQTLIINRVRIADVGIYTATITNPALPNLTLQRRQIVLNVECGEGLEFELAQPTQTVFCEGQPFALRLDISSQFAGSPQVRWRRNGTVIAFANDRNYTVTQPGNYIAEIVTAGGCTARSNEVEITTLPQPELVIELVENRIFTSSVSSTESVIYQWLRDGQVIENASEAIYTPTETGEYSLLIRSEAGCSSVSESIIFTATDITAIEEPIELRGLTLFPNPNNGTFFLDFGKDYPNGIPKFVLIDALGREISLKVEQISSTRYQVFANRLAGGMYQLRVETLDGTAIRKFVLSE